MYNVRKIISTVTLLYSIPGFPDKPVRRIPMFQQFRTLNIRHANFHIVEHAREEIVHLFCHVENVAYAEEVQ